MSKHIRATEAARNFSDLLSRVAYGRETFVVTRGAKPVAEIRPITKVVMLADLPKLMANLPHLSLEEADAFAHDVEQGRRQLDEIGLRDPWAS